MRHITASRYHDFSMGHAVVGHDSGCQHLHGHNYRIHFHCRAANLNELGMVIDFKDIKSKLCQWLEDNWDHKMVLWSQDHRATMLQSIHEPVVMVPFNPTAENLAEFLLKVMAPAELSDTYIECYAIDLWETRKCYVRVELDE